MQQLAQQARLAHFMRLQQLRQEEERRQVSLKASIQFSEVNTIYDVDFPRASRAEEIGTRGKVQFSLKRIAITCIPL